MAKVIFRKLLSEREIEDISVDSAGVLEQHGAPAQPNARAVIIERYGEDLLESHRAKTLNTAMVATAHRIVAMDSEVEKRIVNTFWGARAKILAFDIEDPIGRPIEVYRSCARDIERSLRDRFDELV
jgi:protein-tyrosine-phosphatase